MTTPTCRLDDDALDTASNLGSCVGPDIDYVKVFDESIGAHVILAEGKHHYETDKTLTPVEQMKGSALAGLKYDLLFPSPQSRRT